MLAAQLSSSLQNSLQGLLWQFLVSFQSQSGGGHTAAQPLSPLEMTISLQMLLMMKAGPLLPEQICAFCQPWQSEMETQRSVNGP